MAAAVERPDRLDLWQGLLRSFQPKIQVGLSSTNFLVGQAA
jgi:hypothetical protein